MMLFWAGLRGAVGVALAAGMKGEHAAALRTTVLATVVFTVVAFGGTIGRMVEILGIKTGVIEDDDDESDDEAAGGPYQVVDNGDLEGRRSSKRRSFPLGGTSTTPGTSHHFASQQYAPSSTVRPSYELESPYKDPHYAQQHPQRPASRLGARALPREQPLRASDLSPSSDDESDPDVLPGASSGGGSGLAGDLGSAAAAAAGGLGQVWSALDEQYLLPVFSNTTANRTHAARQKMRASQAGRRGAAMSSHGGFDGDDEGDSARSPYGMGRNPSFGVRPPLLSLFLLRRRRPGANSLLHVPAGHHERARRARPVVVDRPVLVVDPEPQPLGVLLGLERTSVARRVSSSGSCRLERRRAHAAAEQEQRERRRGRRGGGSAARRLAGLGVDDVERRERRVGRDRRPDAGAAVRAGGRERCEESVDARARRAGQGRPRAVALARVQSSVIQRYMLSASFSRRETLQALQRTCDEPSRRRTGSPLDNSSFAAFTSSSSSGCRRPHLRTPTWTRSTHPPHQLRPPPLPTTTSRPSTRRLMRPSSPTTRPSSPA